MSAALELSAVAVVLAGLAVAYLLWVLFLAVMALQHAWSRLPSLVRALAVPAVVVAIALDVAFNLLASIPFADLPREWTLSQRMGRYKLSYTNGRLGAVWRAKVAQWVCANLLDPFEIGGHCR